MQIQGGEGLKTSHMSRNVERKPIAMTPDAAMMTNTVHNRKLAISGRDFGRSWIARNAKDDSRKHTAGLTVRCNVRNLRSHPPALSKATAVCSSRAPVQHMKMV